MVKTLDPANGLAVDWQVGKPQLPDRPLWSLAADIGGGDSPLGLVGAYGVTVADVMARGAGEAVERYALVPRAGRGPRSRTATFAELDGLDFAAASLGDPVALGRTLNWYEGWWLGSGDPVFVPAGLVDHPAPDEDWFDPTPSGAAAGGSLEFAVTNAVLEIVERDAVLTAWAQEVPLAPIDLDALPANPVPHRFTRLLADARGQGLAPVLAPVPTRAAGVYTVLAAIVDRHRGGRLAAVGVKASFDPARALLVALQEALQVRTLLLHLDPQGTVAPVVRDDLDRARLWTTEPAVRALERWIGESTPLPWAPDWHNPAQSPAELAAGLGARAAVVDLTLRLPEVHRAMGWHVVKAVVPGYQALRMDERKAFTWRVRATNDLPHPLI